MEKKYLNEALIGNDRMVASFSSKGELLRLFYPARDCRQFVDTMYMGLKVNDSMLIYLHDDINNKYNQYYSENTNVLNTEIENTYFNIDILQTDFVSCSENVLIKKYSFTNNNSIELDVKFIVYSKLLSSFNNMVGSRIEDNVMKQYSHNYTFSIFSKSELLTWCLNGSREDIKDGILHDKDYVAMASDSAISYEIGKLKPGETKEFELFIFVNNNRELHGFNESGKNIERIRKINVNKELENTKKYWRNYVKEHDGIGLLNEAKMENTAENGIEKKAEDIVEKKAEDIVEKKVENIVEKIKEEEIENAKWQEFFKKETLEKLKKIYIRSILLFPLLSNNATGGISAALEVDEQKDKSGRYSYCWPRDAVFITKALDMLKMNTETEHFYTEFSKRTQNNNGMWEQRYFTDGRLAPCWGYQIDETASIIYGVYEHYKVVNKKEFLNQTLEMCEKGVEFLKKYIDYIVVGKPTNKDGKKEIFEKYESYDLWEMHEGVHLYSLSAIYAAFSSMKEIYIKINKEEYKIQIDKMEEYKEKISRYAIENLCNKETKVLKRSNKDEITDISIIGAIVPFEMFEKNQKEVKNTIEKINLTLRTYTGGYIRFENDTYIGGNNPWPIATLWMALYNIKIGKKEEAIKNIEFVVNTATQNNLLAEQVDNETMKSKWVIGLGWSHAMFVIALEYLDKLCRNLGISKN